MQKSSSYAQMAPNDALKLCPTKDSPLFSVSHHHVGKLLAFDAFS